MLTKQNQWITAGNYPSNHLSVPSTKWAAVGSGPRGGIMHNILIIK